MRTKNAHKKRRNPLSLDPAALLINANTYLETGQASSAFEAANKALAILQIQKSSTSPFITLPALNLLGEICLELGDPSRASEYFNQAVDIDQDGSASESEGGGAEKFLWLAQLCDDGGEKSVQWFQKGVDCLRRGIEELENKLHSLSTSQTYPTQTQIQKLQEDLEEKRQKASAALCGIIEVYMTDLSWDPSAESQCETHITTALSLAPSSPSPLQTLASIRLSQSNLPAARTALTSSLVLWTPLPFSHPKVPDFSTRISLSRLLMEAEMEDEAIEVLEGLVSEDDESVEAWYLGGWCLWLVGEKQEGEEQRAARRESRNWLNTCLELYRKVEYEDERLQEHAMELVEGLDKVLGEAPGDDDKEENDDEDGNGWEDDDDDASAGEAQDEKLSMDTDVATDQNNHDHPMSGT